MAGKLGGVIVDAIRNRTAEEHPILRDMAAAGVRAVADRLQARGQNVTETERAGIEAAIVQDLAADPVLVNNVSAEPLNASRTFTGGSYAAIGGIGIILSQIGDFVSKFDGSEGYGWQFWIQLVMILFGGLSTSGGVLSMVGRASNALEPMTRKWWNPTTWFAPKAPE